MKLRSSSFSAPSLSSGSRTRSPSAPPKLETPKTVKPETMSKPKAPTASELQAGKNNLKPADHGVVHPDLPGIRTRRDNGQSGAQFADFTQDARNSTNKLMSRPVGNQMLTELDGRTQHVNPGKTGTPQKPLTVADIYSGRDESMPMSHRPRHDGTLQSVRQAYRQDGQAGTGQASRINYNEQDPGQRFNSLGHESVHAWRAANGTQVSPLAVSKHSNADVFKRYPDHSAAMKDTVETRLQLREEFETVGLRPTPRMPNAPTENAIRAEHGLPARQDYSGFRPGANKNDANFENYDLGSDDRGRFQKLMGTPSPLGKIVGDLEK
ncbi:M91 family zinc metallopeptidase [Corallococcus caeni]|uniref:M91 family zinc metallopeptidase n=1 Tax=Corallococcus caeni TaxID=3082388 RepID=UPI0030C68859